MSGIGLTFDTTTRKLTGTPPAPQAKVTYTYTATESSDSDGTTESASKTFTIGIQPKQPADFAAVAGAAKVSLNWDTIPGVSGWEYQQDTGGWTAIPNSGPITSSHIVTGLSNGTEYTCKVRAVAGTGGAAVAGAASDAAKATPAATIAPPESPRGDSGDRQATLMWEAIAGVSGWEYSQQNQDGTLSEDGLSATAATWGAWTDISGSGAASNNYSVTGLSNGTTCRFQVRAYVTSGGTRTNGMESDTIVVTPSSPPTFNDEIAEQKYTQGKQAVLLFPKATPGNPDNTYRHLRYRLSPANPSGFNQSVSFWRGTPNRPMAKTLYTYTVRESKGGSASITFLVSIKPRKPAGFSATAGSGQAALKWKAIAGVDSWQVKQDSGNWTAISGSGATINSHTVPA